MTQLSDLEKSLFPLCDIGTVVKFFKTHLENNDTPNLAVCSIIIGYIENTLTCSRVIDLAEEEDDNANGEAITKDPLNKKIPVIEYDNVMALYHRFLAIVKTHVDITAFGSPKFATRELVKRVSDVVWCTLSSSYYKDRAHLQSIYSYMTGAKLDSTGTTLAVVAAFQCLGYCDVHLALSEDHTWVVCGENGEVSVEVTWHGKGNEDKRGIPVTEEVYLKSWLYVNGKPIICSRHMELAAIVSNMNPGINATTDSEEVLLLQQALLWFFHDSGFLDRYPMAIDNLADLEEMNPSIGRPPAIKMYEEAILSNIRFYDNQHVYPYAYLAGYCYRNQHYKLALKAWARAAKVIRNYNYSRDDEEIYKEFLDVATELIPHLIRSCSSSANECDEALEGSRSALEDPCSFSALLEFYDGICLWEEDSSTPVLHIGWAKALQSSIAKFDSKVRSKLTIVCEDEDESRDASNEGVGEEQFLAFIKQESFLRTSTSTHDQNGNTSKLLLKQRKVTPSLDSPPLHLYSAKMRGLKDLVLADKPNSQAISLLLSAQSQVTMTKKRERGGGSSALPDNNSEANQQTFTGRTKRARREN